MLYALYCKVLHQMPFEHSKSTFPFWKHQNDRQYEWKPHFLSDLLWKAVKKEKKVKNIWIWQHGKHTLGIIMIHVHEAIETIRACMWEWIFWIVTKVTMNPTVFLWYSYKGGSPTFTTKKQFMKITHHDHSNHDHFEA